MRQISRLLKERYKIPLERSSVIRHLMELWEDPDVQINNECTMPLKPRYESRWYKVIEHLKVAISDYTRLHRAKPSFRTMQYHLIDEGIITDGESDHKSFGDATVKARLGWVDSNDELLYPKLDIDCFADDEPACSRQISRLPSNRTNRSGINSRSRGIGIYRIRRGET